MVARCLKCGGRAEGLADLGLDADLQGPRQDGAEVGVVKPSMSADRRPDALTDAVERVTNSLRSRHRSCARSPHEHALPPMSERFVDRVLTGARQSLESGGVVEGNLHLLLDDGRGCTLPTGQILRDAPPRSPERDRNRVAAVSATRAFLRARDWRPATAVLLSEVCMSEMKETDRRPTKDQRDEVVVASVVTPDFGRVGYSPIERVGGSVDEGPGRFGALDWRPLTQPARLVDVLFAGSDLVIEKPDEVERRSGDTLSWESRN